MSSNSKDSPFLDCSPQEFCLRTGRFGAFAEFVTTYKTMRQAWENCTNPSYLYSLWLLTVSGSHKRHNEDICEELRKLMKDQDIKHDLEFLHANRDNLSLHLSVLKNYVGQMEIIHILRQYWPNPFPKKNPIKLEEYQKYTADLFARYRLRYGNQPYVEHIKDVRRVLNHFGFTEFSHPELHGGAIGHDTFEDIPQASRNSIETIINDHLILGVPREWIDIALGVTQEPGANRKERIKNTYPKIRSNEKFIILKLADRIADLENALDQSKVKIQQRYAREHQAFRDNLASYSPTSANEMWKLLDIMIGELELDNG